MEARPDNMEKFIKARNRVDNIKRFYAHLVLFIFANGLLLLFKDRIVDYAVSKGFNDPGFINWVSWNIYFIPILWGLVLLVSGLYLFRFKGNFLKRWEERQIEKYMHEDDGG